MVPPPSPVTLVTSYALLSAAVQFTYNFYMSSVLFSTADIVCSPAGPGDQIEQVDDTVPAADHPWVNMMHRLPAAVVPLGSAKACLMRKNLITQLAAMACRQHVVPHMRLTYPLSHPMLFFTVHTTCIHLALPMVATEHMAAGGGDGGNAWRNRPLLVVLRDPIERFVAGYVQACLSYYNYPSHLLLQAESRCLGCAVADVCCFARRLARILRRPAALAGLHAGAADYAGAHVMPQAHNCRLNETLAQRRAKRTMWTGGGSRPAIDAVWWPDRVAGVRRALRTYGVHTGPALARADSAAGRFEPGWGVNGAQHFLGDAVGHETRLASRRAMDALRRSEEHMAVLRRIYQRDYELIGELIGAV